MSTTFRPYAPDQMLLLPADLRAWLPEGHLAHHVSDLVDGVDLTAFYAPYAGDGRRNAPYAPRMMVKVLLYAYATGVFSSRGIARKLEEDVAFRVLGAGNFPQHRTLCEFRRRHLSDFKELFVAVGRLARELGLARFGKLSIDGTKVRANASKRKAMSYGRMAKEERRLRGEIEARLAAAGAADAAEDARLGADVRGDELPAELRRREDRLAAIRAAKSRLEAQQRAADDARGRQPDQDRNPKGGQPYKRSYGEPDAKAQSNFTDPESGIMKTSNDGFQQCYNAQVAVDGAHQLVVATEVTANASDQGGEVAPGEGPLEWSSQRLRVPLKGQEPGLHVGQALEVVRREDLALHDRAIDLDLMEPTGMDGPVHQHQIRIPLLQTFHGARPTGRRAVVDDPEHAARVTIGRTRHDLLNQAVDGGDPGGGFAAAKESGVMHIQGGQVGPGAGARVLMFDLHHHPGPGRLCRMAAVARLNARLLIGGDHEVVHLSPPRRARKDPGSARPWSKTLDRAERSSCGDTTAESRRRAASARSCGR